MHRGEKWGIGLDGGESRRREGEGEDKRRGAKTK